MSTIEKILKSWWVIFSAISFLTGIGFIYIGFKHNNKNWAIEGIIYEIPWIMGTALVNVGSLGSIYATICIVLMFVAIVRSIWVAVKLCDVYDNQERYRVQTTIVNNSNISSQNDSFPVIPACCAGLILMFIAFGIISTF